MADRVAVVTGAGRGMGRAVAERLQAGGMRVVWADVAPDVVEAAGESSTGEGIGHVVDITSAESVEDLVATTIDTFGSLDVLANCAGVVSMHPIGELEEAEWRRVLDVNLTGVFLCCRAAVPRMVESGWGRIVSIASDVGRRGEPLMTHYAAAKFGLVGFTQSLALELAAENVTVNAVCPGITETNMLEGVVAELSRSRGVPAEEMLSELIAEIPIGRPGTVDDIADVIEFLVSDQARFVTGQALNVSGGRIMH